MHRRDFLRPSRLASAAGQVLALLDDVEAKPQAAEASLLRFSRRAMATTFQVLLPFDTPHADEAASAALDEIDRLEAQLTIYRDTSEMTRLNRLAGYAPLRVEDGLFELLCEAKTIHEETGGAHDINAGQLVRAWGFYKGPPRVPSPDELTQAMERSGMRHVVLERSERTVRYLRHGIEINLGSIGKGYALDRAASLLRNEYDIRSALLHGGHSSVYAIGSAPGQPRGWPIGLRHPWDAERRMGTVWLRDEALGTSAGTFKHLFHEGRRLGHLLDPRTGWPAEGIASSTVVAPNAAKADALATAFFILGVEGSRAYCDIHPEISAVLLPEGREAALVTIDPSSEPRPRSSEAGG
jgi:thiamine biosynthesis lipoprotein